MAIRMPQPFKRKSGVYHLNVRVPIDLMSKVAGRRITSPLGDSFTSVKASDKVVLSLRTKELAPAIERNAAAFAALNRHWQALRDGPKPVSFMQVVALAGEAYRRRAKPIDEFDPTGPEAIRRERAEAFRSWRDGDEDDRPISDEDAHFLEAIQRPYGPYLLAFETKRDIIDPCLLKPILYEEAIELLFGAEADKLCSEHQLVVDAATRTRLVRQIADAVRLAEARTARLLDGDFSPDQNLARFPALTHPSLDKAGTAAQTARLGAKVTIAVLFERWKAFNVPDHVRPSTVRRYSPSISSLSAFTGARDIRTMSKIDFERWADHRRDVDAIAPATVNRNDLVAASSLFSFATTRESDRDQHGEKQPLRGDNPVKGVKLKKASVQRAREKAFRASEISAILTLARGVIPNANYPKAATRSKTGSLFGRRITIRLS